MKRFQLKTNAKRRRPANTGAAAVLAMMFLVIFSSLAAAMAIVSQGNLATADSSLKIQRSLAAADTGMEYMMIRLQRIARTVTTTDGIIDTTNAPDLWSDGTNGVAVLLRDELNLELNTQGNPAVFNAGTGELTVPSISLGPGAPTFSATFTPHPLAGEDYDDAFYDRAPYDGSSPMTGIDTPISAANPLDSTWIRVVVSATDGAGNNQVSRSISMDFKMDKKIPYAMLSRSRVMIGQNVMISGPVGSRFTETHLDNGHPVVMASDFAGLSSTLDDIIGAPPDPSDPSGSGTFHAQLVDYDTDGDNRIDLNNPTETTGLTDPHLLDLDNDGYLDEFDYFLGEFGQYDTDASLTRVQLTDLESSGVDSTRASQLVELIDTFDPDRNNDGVVDAIDQALGYGDGFIDAKDRYAKIRGEVHITADRTGWEEGAADAQNNDDGAYQDYFTGSIITGDDHPMNFQSTEIDDYVFDASSFDTATVYKSLATGDLFSQADAEAATNPDGDDPNGPQPYTDPDTGDLVTQTESVPFGAAYPYDYYDRPVFENMTFVDVTIPAGTNALFLNCTFRGITYIETETANTDPNYNYAGMQEADGSQKHPDRTADVNGTIVADTKTISNNVRFHNCTFDGAVVSDAPSEFTHTRNKLSFTGATQFKDLTKSVVEDSENGSSLPADDREFYSRSTILSPHYSVELGSFQNGASAGETVTLSGTIVAGIMDMRGQVKVRGSVLSTFEPMSNTGPVLGETSPQFNTTLGYFSAAQGDMEAELPTDGLGVIQLQYDPTLPLPNGIMGPIQVEAVPMTYSEGG